MRGSVARTILTATTGIALGALALSGCSSTSKGASAPQESTATSCPTAEAGASAQDTASYRMVVSASDPETMVTQDEADAQGLTEGELIMGDPMDMGSSGEAKANGHVEVAICDLATGKTVTGADVMMEVVTDGDAHPMMVMEMRGLDEPATESHYGNNTVVPAAPYRMRVTLDGESAEFAMPGAK